MNCEKVLKQNFETEKAQYCRNIDPYRVESMYIFLSFIEMNVQLLCMFIKSFSITQKRLVDVLMKDNQINGSSKILYGHSKCVQTYRTVCEKKSRFYNYIRTYLYFHHFINFSRYSRKHQKPFKLLNNIKWMSTEN